MSHVYNHTFHGDPEISSLYHRLLLGASTPVFTAIKKWIYDGVLNDPFKEVSTYLHSSLSNSLFFSYIYMEFILILSKRFTVNNSHLFFIYIYTTFKKEFLLILSKRIPVNNSQLSLVHLYIYIFISY